MCLAVGVAGPTEALSNILTYCAFPKQRSGVNGSIWLRLQGKDLLRTQSRTTSQKLKTPSSSFRVMHASVCVSASNVDSSQVAANGPEAADLAAMLNDRGFKVEVLASAQPSQEIVLGISEGMKCGGCASRAQRLLAETEGVESAEVSFEDKTAAVQVFLWGVRRFRDSAVL